MRRRLAVAVGALALSLPAAVALAGGSTGGQVRDVSIPGQAFVPGEVDVLVGDTVVWRNGDAGNHTVTARDDSFDSGYLAPGASFAHAFPKPGVYAYYCTIHKFMRGVVRVVPVALSGPTDPIVSGGRLVLHGLAPDGTSRVTVTQVGGRGGGTRSVTPAADGSFSLAERVFAPTTFRAAVGGAASPPVRVQVAPRVTVSVRDRMLVGGVRPSRRGARVALQRYDAERFAWITVGRSRVDGASRIRLALPPAAAGHFRVVVRGDGRWADGASTGVVAR